MRSGLRTKQEKRCCGSEQGAWPTCGQVADGHSPRLDLVRLDARLRGFIHVGAAVHLRPQEEDMTHISRFSRRACAAVFGLTVGIACSSQDQPAVVGGEEPATDLSQEPESDGTTVDNGEASASLADSDAPSDLGQLRAGLGACPPGQVIVAGRCKLIDGQHCTTAASCASNICTSWFIDNDHDGFGTGNAQRFCGTNVPRPGGFVTRSGDCCDSSADAFPGQTLRFGAPLPDECVRSAALDHDYNCNGRNDGAPTINCSLRSQATCAIGNSTTGRNPGDIVPTPQIDTGDVPNGLVLCGQSVGPGTCAFFTAAHPSPFGLTGCAPNLVGFTQLPCN